VCGHVVSLGGQIILPSFTTLRVTGDCVNSNSVTESFRLIFLEDLLLVRYSPDLILVTASGDLEVDHRIVFQGGLGPNGEIGVFEVEAFFIGEADCSPSSNSGPKENEGGSHTSW
jgi:hypothetical protein